MIHSGCRICSDNNSHRVDLFSISFKDHSLSYLIHRYLYFKVEKEDGLPQEICSICLIQITEMHKFAKSAAKIQEMFILQGAKENAEESTSLAKGGNTKTPVHPSNNEENREYLAPLKYEETSDCALNNCENNQSPSKTPDETIEQGEENCFESSFGGQEIVTLEELPETFLTNNLEGGNVNGPQKENEVTILIIASELVVATGGDHTSHDSLEISNTLLSSNNIQIEGENSGTATTEVEKSGDTRQPDDTPEENTEEENRKQSNQKCSISAKHSSDGKEVKNRLLTKTEVFLYKCPYCDYINSEKHLLKKHIDRRHNKTCNKYDIYKEVYVRKQPPNYTKSNHVGEKSYFCKFCNKVFPWQYRLNNHYRMEHRDEKPYKCELCEKTFIEKRTLKRHFLLHEEGKSDWPRCSVCKKVFPKKNDLNKHMIIVHDNAFHYKCEICKRNFSKKLDLKRHIYLHLRVTKRSLKCKKCNEHFYDDYELIKHMMNQSNRMPYTCNLCKMDLVPNDKLYEHFEYQHKCQISVKCEICDKTFTTKDSLKKHSCPHEGEKLYICPICQNIFSTQQAKSQHMTKKHQITVRSDYKCDICNRYILTKKNLILHINLHFSQNGKVFMCKLCHYRFPYKYQLENHFLSSKHRENSVRSLKKSV